MTEKGMMKLTLLDMGRHTFRQMYRNQAAIADQYGIALMMIREGCADPRRIAADALSKRISE